MSKKLRLSPKISYFLGMYAYSPSRAIGVIARNSEMLQRFIEIALKEYKVEPNDIHVDEKENETQAYFYNTKLKKLLGKALERKEKTFAYKNAYAACYVAAIYDTVGGKDPKGIFIKRLKATDDIIIERLGFRTKKRGIKTYIANPNEFISFIGGYATTI